MYLGFILTLASHLSLGLPSDFLFEKFRKILFTFPIYEYLCLSQLIVLGVITLT
jgi:hypothetical protein